jgi:site-specific recombinase XerD
MESDLIILDKFAAALKDKGNLPPTIESYCRDVKGFLNFVRRANIPYTHLDANALVEFQEHLSHIEKEKSNSVRRKVIGVRQFFRFLRDGKIIDSSPFDEVPIPERKDTAPLEISTAKMEIILSLPSNPDFKSFRNAALICLLGFEAVKAHELTELTWQDFLPASGDKPSYLAIKGTRHRTIPLDQRTTQNLKRYKEEFDKFFEGQTRPKKMFVAFQGRDERHILPEITRHGLKFILYEIGDKAHIRRLNTEALRHYAIKHLVANGMSPEAIMLHLGLRRLGIIARHLKTKPPE